MKRNIAREIVLAAALGLLLFGPAIVAAQTNAPAPPARGGFPDLVGALKATPGVLGVDTAQTGSGKQVIFAWFENKQAVMTWYNSELHRGLMASLGGGPPRSEGPLAGIKDETIPVLAVASVTPDAAANGDFRKVRQISIELYTPLPGGIAIGGRFAPASMTVPGLMDLPLSAVTRQEKK